MANQRHSQTDKDFRDEDLSEERSGAETNASTKVLPAEQFESKLTELIQEVLSRKMQPSEAVRALHVFWRGSFSDGERESLINRDTVGNIHEAGSRLMQAANMIGNEMPTLVSYVMNTKSLG